MRIPLADVGRVVVITAWIAASSMWTSACTPAEACACTEGSASLEVEPVPASTLVEVTLVAVAQGGRCGCSDGRPAEIVDYAWDLDGDGLEDVAGATRDTVAVQFDTPGVHVVRVWVTDAFGYVVEASVSVPVE